MGDEAIITRRKKSGFPNQSAFDDSQAIHSFSKICRALLETKIFPYGLKVDERSLANASFQLQTFMESTLGKASHISARSITKIPQDNFRDYSVDGSLMTILTVALKHQMDAGWKTFNLMTSDRFSRGLEIIRDAVAALQENRMLRRPQVYIGRVPSNVTQVMRKIIIDHGGAIMEDIASATHVVDWDEEVDSLPSELTEEFVRTLEVRPSEDSGTALVHWFYHPDSYDEWIPSDHVDGSEPPDTVPQASELNVDRQWHVCCRFVMDCEIFNEWGNEIDYENLPEGEGDDDDVNDENNQERSPVKASAGRKARGRRRLDSIKAKKVPILESITVTEKMMQDVLPPLLDPILDTATVVDMFIGNECQLTSVKYGSQRVKESSSSEAIEHEADAPEVPESQITDEPPVPPIKRKADVLTETPVESTGNAVPSVVKVKKEKSAGKKGSFQSQLKLPSWYNSESLNALEIRYLPDFFANDADRLKNSPEYFRVRNYIVSLYAHNPSVYLSATDCRRKLSGDVCVVLRIHSFLDAFGVINFNIKADCRPVIGQASLSYWSEDLLSKYTSNILYAPAGSSSAVMTSPDPASDDVDVEWSEEMDTSLRRSAVACSGDWDKVADTLTHEYSDDSEGTWKPKSEECLARFVSLSLPPPQFSGTMTEGSTGIALTSIASGPKSRKMRYLGAQVAERALSVLGRDETQRLVSSVLPGPHKQKAVMEVENAADSRANPYSSDYVTFRLDLLEQKMALIQDVDLSIDLERDRVEMDVRDIQMQRALLCLQR